MEATPASYESLDVPRRSNLVHVVDEKAAPEVRNPTMTRPAQAECLLDGAPRLAETNLGDRAVKDNDSAAG